MIDIVWIGCHTEGIPAFENVLKSENVISAFITLDDSHFSKRSAGTRQYKEYCLKYNIPYYTVSSIKSDQAYEIVKKYAPKLLVVLGWSEILPERLLEIPTIGTIGAHAALLPHNKGSAPINWALIHGEEITGNTLMWLSPNVDSGAIIDQMEIAITPYDSCKTLYEHVAETNAVMLERLLNKLNKNEMPHSGIENSNSEPLLPRRKPEDGLICWDKSGEEVYNFIRALTEPYPGAFTYLNGEKWIIWKASLLSIRSAGQAGHILGEMYGFYENGSGYIVGTGTKCIVISEMEDSKGRRYSGKELHDLNFEGKFSNE